MAVQRIICAHVIEEVNVYNNVTDSQTVVVVSKKARTRKKGLNSLPGRVLLFERSKRGGNITTYDVITRMGFHELSTVILLSAL